MLKSAIALEHTLLSTDCEPAVAVSCDREWAVVGGYQNKLCPVLVAASALVGVL